MWRIALSIGLTFAAMAWSALGIVVIFLIVPSLWESLFGPRGAAFGALGALAAMVWASAKLLSLADRLGGGEGRRAAQPAEAQVDPDAPTSWPEYNASIARNKRWAFYRRTRQFDRLAELEAEARRAGEAREQLE